MKSLTLEFADETHNSKAGQSVRKAPQLESCDRDSMSRFHCSREGFCPHASTCRAGQELNESCHAIAGSAG